MQATKVSSTRPSIAVGLGHWLAQRARGARLQRGLLFGSIILLALVAFESFNYSTTEFALADLLGGLQFAGLRWSTILALAFCSIDFAGIARLMTPASANHTPGETWYLLGAWFLGATMNAMLTWWAVSLALIGHAGLGNEILGREALLSGVPLFIASLVWLIRVLLIGSLTLAGERLFSFAEARPRPASSPSPTQARAGATQPAHRPAPSAASAGGRPTPMPTGMHR